MCTVYKIGDHEVPVVTSLSLIWTVTLVQELHNYIFSLSSSLFPPSPTLLSLTPAFYHVKHPAI